MKLHKSEKGLGTIVAAIMFLLTTILFIGGTFLWQSTNEAHMNAFEKDRMDETISVEASYVYNDMSGFYETQLKVKNTGPIDIQIIQAWIIDVDNNDHKSVDCYYPIAVDNFDNVAEIEALQLLLKHTFDLKNDSSPTYFFRVVTERGNIASSRLMPRATFISNWPAVIVPEASKVVRDTEHGPLQSKGYIQLVVYNRLKDDIHLTLIVASRLDVGSEASEVIKDFNWILEAGVQQASVFWGYENKIYNVDQIVFIELADIDGIVVSSYYFVCQ